MTPLHGVWISSCIGAVLFWLAGYLSARRRTTALPAPAVSDGPDPTRLQAELKAALDRELRLVADLAIAQGEQTAANAALRQSGAQSGEQLAALKTELEAARRAREVASIEARDARAAEQSAIDSAAQRIAALERRLAEGATTDSSRALARLEQELERTRAEAGARETESKRLRASFDQLQAEKKELLGRLAAANSSPPAPQPAPRSDHQENLQAELERLRVAVLHARSERDGSLARARELESELQRLRKGGSTILGQKDALATAERTKHELRLARNELARLQKELDEPKLARAKALTGEVAASTLPPGELGELLRSLLEEVTRNGRTRGAVVADGSGLVVASSGGEGEALAAAAAVFVDNASRVLRSVLPLGTLQNLSVVDEHDVTIAALPLAVGDHGLILATLSDGPGPDPASVRAVIGKA